jgi:hypothetical protein
MNTEQAIALLERKRLSDEEQTLRPARLVAQGITGVIQANAANRAKVNENKLELWKKQLANYDMTDKSGEPLDAQQTNIVFGYIAQHGDLPPTVMLSPKQTSTFTLGADGKPVITGNVPKGAKDVSPKITNILNSSGEEVNKVEGNVKVLPQTHTPEDKRNMRLEVLKPKKIQEVYDTVNSNNVLRGNVTQALDSATRIGTGLGGKIKYSYLKNFKPNDPVLADWQNVKSMLTDTQLLYTAKTKGAISDREMELFANAAANDDLKSLPEIQSVLSRMVQKLNANEDTVINSYKQSFGENPLDWEDLKSNRGKSVSYGNTKNTGSKFSILQVE